MLDLQNFYILTFNMKNNYKSYIKFLLIIAISLVCVVQLTSIIIDPYNVFGITNFNKRNFPPNTRYLKIEYLAKKNEYNAFILGNSRAYFYNVKSANQLSNNTYNYYNMAVVRETVKGLRRRVEWLVANKKVKNLILALDYDLVLTKINPLELLVQDHPKVTGESWRSFYFKYSLFQPTSLINCIKENLRKEEVYVFDISTGQIQLPYNNYLMKKDPEKYLKEKFIYPIKIKETVKANENGIEEIKKIADILAKNKIDVTVIINPNNHHNSGRWESESYTKWLKRIVEIFGEVWDFSGFNSITTNDRLYYEPNHFNNYVGDLVLSRVFNNKTIVKQIPEDFGFRIIKDNLDIHMQRIKEEYNQYYQTYK